MTKSPDTADVVVIGAGVAGLTAAVSAAERLQGIGTVMLLDRADPADAGGLTKWTAAYLRLDEIDDPGAAFVSDVVSFSDGQSPSWYVDELVQHTPDTMQWIQDLGARFERLPTYFINSSRGRLQPVGGGNALLEALHPQASRLGVTIRYRTLARQLVTDRTGAVVGVTVQDDQGVHDILARTVIIASGGFEGDPEFLDRELGQHGRPLIPIAPGCHFNKGEGIQMALDAGAARRGQWDNFHAEPVDPRSSDPEALVMVYPYGILVNNRGRRFTDEGRGTVDETYEEISRAIWDQPDGIAYMITDKQHDQVGQWVRGVLTAVEPFRAETLTELATQIGIPPADLEATVAEFNAAVDASTPFRWQTPDGRSAAAVTPPKSNWALAVGQGPFLAYPISCAIVFTYGGLAVNERSEVVDADNRPIPHLYAAGECTGLYYGKYPGGTSVLRSMVFGRIAGQAAASTVGTSPTARIAVPAKL